MFTDIHVNLQVGSFSATVTIRMGYLAAFHSVHVSCCTTHQGENIDVWILLVCRLVEMDIGPLDSVCICL